MAEQKKFTVRVECHFGEFKACIDELLAAAESMGPGYLKSVKRRAQALCDAQRLAVFETVDASFRGGVIAIAVRPSATLLRFLEGVRLLANEYGG